MKWLVLAGTALFWFAMTAIWTFAAWAPPAARQAVATAAASDTEFTSDQVAAHDGSASCWLVIDGQVYDVTTYVETHPANPRTILDHCGEEATRSFETKDRNRPHSNEARQLLDRYRIGTFSKN